MTPHRTCLLGTLVCSIFVGACGNDSPAKPTLTIGTPRLVEPAQGAQIANLSQPVTVTLENATTTGTATLTYTIEVATDDQFTGKVFTKDRIPAGANGRTSQTLSALTSGKAYHWRARAEDVGNGVGTFATSSFSIGLAIAVGSPAAVSPAQGATLELTRPTLTVSNASKTGPVGAVVYRFEVSESAGFSPVTVTGTVNENPAGQTSYTTDVDLASDKTFYWRVRATDSTSGVAGDFSTAASFKTQAAFNLSQVVVVKGPNVSKWPETGKITELVQDGNTLCIYHDKLGVWPATFFFGDPAQGLVEGNQWVIIKINGTWYTGANEWYRPGQACKTGLSAGAIFFDSFNSFEEPLHSAVPQQGEMIGYFSTTPARAYPAMSTVDERTNVHFQPWTN